MSTSEPKEDRLTTGQAGQRLGCTINTVVKLWRAGRIRGSRLGAHLRLDAKSVDEYLRKSYDPAFAAEPWPFQPERHKRWRRKRTHKNARKTIA